jgi:endopeptidase Clp ATP-binding regulatory subunit ClpX
MSDDKNKDLQEEIHKEVQGFVKRLQEKYGLRGISAKMVTGQEVPLGRIDLAKEPVEEKVDLNFDLTPREIKAELDKYVIKQEAAKKYLANAAYYHYKHVEKELSTGKSHEDYQKNNIIMVGNTGVGKTLLLKRLARILGVPMVKGDATKFSKTGYVGDDVENLVRDLVREADGNVNLAQCGMIFIDEIDKIATDKSIIGRDITGTGVQTELLKPMEETEVELVSTADPISMMQGLMRSGGDKRPTINTRNILFIVGGAFPGLADIIKKRMHHQRVGFKGEVVSEGERDTYLPHVTTEDFVEYGLIEELVGRLPIRVVLEDLTEEDLYLILKHSRSAITRQHIRDFSLIDVKLEFTSDALKRIAQLAHKEKTGARGLMTVCEKVLSSFKYELPGKNVDQLTITRETVEHPENDLQKVLLLKPLETFISQFQKSTGIVIQFSADAKEFLAEKMSSDQGLDVVQFCWEKLNGCDRLLEMVGLKEVEVTAETLKNPMKEIAAMVNKIN